MIKACRDCIYYKRNFIFEDECTHEIAIFEYNYVNGKPSYLSAQSTRRYYCHTRAIYFEPKKLAESPGKK